MKKAICLLALLLPVYSFAQRDSICVLKANIKGLGNDKISLFYSTDSLAYPYRNLEVQAHHGKFTYKVKIYEPRTYHFIYHKKATEKSKQVYASLRLFLEPGHMTLSGGIDSLDKAVITGSPLTTEWQKIEKAIDSLQDKLMAKRADTTDPVNSQAQGTKLWNELMAFRKAYIAAHPSSPVSLQVLLDEYAYSVRPRQSIPLFNMLDTTVRSTAPARLFRHKAEISLLTDSGRTVLEVNLLDTADHPLKLSSYRGKLTLLDFWASWCGPCRMENPTVVAAYQRFHDKGFDIYSVSLDGDKNAWKAAIAKDNLSWSGHVCDFKAFLSDAAVAYAIEGIPDNFLIDANGIIIARDLRGKDLEKKLESLLK